LVLIYRALVCILTALSVVQCGPVKQASQRPSTQKAASSNETENSRSYYHFLVGEISNLSSDPETALQHFQIASQYDSHSNVLRLKQAEQLVGLGQLSSANEIMKSLSNSEDPEYHLLAARISAIELDFDQSEKSLDKAIQIYSKNGDSRKRREILLMKIALLSDSRQYDKAKSALLKHLKDEPEDEIAYYFLGKVHSILQEREKAIAAYRRALEIKPYFSTVSRALGLQLELMEQNIEAIDTYQQALVFGSDDNYFRQKLANLYLVEEQYPKALEQFKQLLVAEPEDVQLTFRTALLYFKLEQYDEAESLLKSLLKDNDINHDRIHFYLGALYEERNQNDLAIANFSKVQFSSEYFVDSRLQASSIAQKKLNQPERSITLLVEGVSLNPKSKELYITLATQQEQLNKLEEAIQTLRQASIEIKDSEQILFLLGTFLDRNSKIEEGLSLMRRVLEINPDHAHAMNHIGYVLTLENRDLEQAESILLKAVQLEPENAYIVDSLGWLYYKKKNFKKSREYLEQAYKKEPNEPEIIEHLADVYSKLGQDDRALQMYKKLVRNNSEKNSSNEGAKAPLINKDREARIKEKIASLTTDHTF